MLSELIQLRNELPALVDGQVSLVESIDMEKGMIGFQRGAGNDAVLVVLNTLLKSQIVDFSGEFDGREIWLHYSNGKRAPARKSLSGLIVPPLAIQVYSLSD